MSQKSERSPSLSSDLASLTLDFSSSESSGGGIEKEMDFAFGLLDPLPIVFGLMDDFRFERAGAELSRLELSRLGLELLSR